MARPRPWVRLRLLGTVAMLLLAQASWAQFGLLPPLQILPENPSDFSSAATPRVLCYLPGNAGSLAFGEKPPEVPATSGTAYDELRCNAQILVLDSPGYRHRISLRGRNDASDSDWWRTLRESLASAAKAQIRSELRVNNSFLRRLRSGAAGAEMRFVERLVASLGPEATAPLISFEASSAENLITMHRLREALRSGLPRALVGGVLEQIPQTREEIRGWDYVILRPQRLPEWQRGQAAMAALRARLGNLPIVLRLEEPNFYRDLVYLATGAAGFQYDAFPLSRGPERERRLRSLRAFGATAGRLRAGAARLMPEHAVPGTIGAYGIPGEVYCLLLARGAQPTFRPPAIAGRPDFFGSWYRPATDEMITRPRNQAQRISSGALLLRPPEDQGAWIYCHYPLAAETGEAVGRSNPEF